MYVIGHYHIAPYRNVLALRRSQTKSDKRVMNVFGSEHGTSSVGAKRNKKKLVCPAPMTREAVAEETSAHSIVAASL
jgi:hypothetical protein